MTTNKITAAVRAERFGNFYVGRYGLIDDLKRKRS